MNVAQARLPEVEQPPQAVVRHGRIVFLDGLRGISALHVMFAHYALAFYPEGFWQLGFFSNSFISLCLFFLISGYVLTYSFEKMPGDILVNIVRRLVRIGLPYFPAVLFSALLASAGWGVTHAVAVAAASDWLLKMTALPALTGLWADISGASLFVGYFQNSLFQFPGLPDQLHALDPPVWTLHVELYGSLWIIGLVWAQRFGAWLYGALLFLSLFVFGFDELALFTIGHLLAQISRHERLARLLVFPKRQWFGVAMIVAGIWLSDADTLNVPLPDAIFPGGVFHIPEIYRAQTQWGAILIFLGILLTPVLQRVFDTAVFQFLGRLSYSVYLLHFAIMISLGSAVFLLMLKFGAGIAMLLAWLAGLGATVPVALLFQWGVDEPAIRLSRKITRKKTSEAKLAPVR
ncbi:MAG: acyltransferase [Acidocella sp.]|nr:acyltransferase [Acidocella sp.]